MQSLYDNPVAHQFLSCFVCLALLCGARSYFGVHGLEQTYLSMGYILEFAVQLMP